MEFLENLTIREVINYIVGIMVVFSVIVEFNKRLPWKPITHIIEWFGGALTKNLNTKMEELSKQTKANNEAIIELDKKVEERFAENQKEADEKEAKRLRASIISFSDACRADAHHSKNHFENIFRGIDDYNTYCERHHIPNHFINSEVAYITEVYNHVLKENKFI